METGCHGRQTVSGGRCLRLKFESHHPLVFGMEQKIIVAILVVDCPPQKVALLEKEVFIFATWRRKEEPHHAPKSLSALPMTNTGMECKEELVQ